MGGILSTNGDSHTGHRNKEISPHSPSKTVSCGQDASNRDETDVLQATACTITPRRTPGVNRIPKFGSPKTPHFSPRKERFKFTPDERNKRVPSDEYVFKASQKIRCGRLNNEMEYKDSVKRRHQRNLEFSSCTPFRYRNALYADWPGDLYEAPMFCDFSREKQRNRRQRTAGHRNDDAHAMGKENVVKSSIVLKLFDNDNTKPPNRSHSNCSDTDDEWFARPHPGHERLGNEKRDPKPLLSERDLVICESYRLARNRRCQHATDDGHTPEDHEQVDSSNSPTGFTASVGGALQSVLSW
eukprot:m.128681 g.128681  ORF g.128681 m.128681 type:complete len:299 (+) comp17439_c0_seq1:150-1046(+)